jgi:hypothetical protein
LGDRLAEGPVELPEAGGVSGIIDGINRTRMK